MVVSYETLRTLQEELANCPVGLLLCDEGHRLKNADSQTFQALTTLQCKRRVILSGTPIQNDLSEYFALLNFANPDYLGTRLDFRKNFELKILRGRDADASEKERVESDAKLKELGGLVSKFIIRRTNDLLSKYCEYDVPASLKLYLTHLFSSAGQIRACRVLWAQSCTDCSLSVVHHFSRDTKAVEGNRFSASQSYQHLAEIVQSP
jgi:hypothetical protein